MKIFKWYLIDDIDKHCLEAGYNQELNRKLKIAEDKNWEQYLIIEKLKEQNKYLSNLLDRKIIQEIGEPIDYRRINEKN